MLNCVGWCCGCGCVLLCRSWIGVVLCIAVLLCVVACCVSCFGVVCCEQVALRCVVFCV